MVQLSQQDFDELNNLIQRLTITNPVEQAVLEDARAGIILSGATQPYQAQLYRQFKALSHIEQALFLLEKTDNELTDTTTDEFQIESRQRDLLRKLVLEEVPKTKKIAILKVVRSITGFMLKDAKAVVESTPYSFSQLYSLEEADEIAWQLEQAGAKVSVYLAK